MSCFVGSGHGHHFERGSRRVHLAGCTTNPTGAWVIQQAVAIERRDLLGGLIHEYRTFVGGPIDFRQAGSRGRRPSWIECETHSQRRSGKE
ncbi:MAG: hypothetical protein H0W90_13850 [Actinobacteria bacterium]|nr:hypothetical protein [Actinomycetota bacterium]